MRRSGHEDLRRDGHFNSAKTIAHSVESFLKQSHRDKQLVVVDGASTDDTLAIVRSFSCENITNISEPDRGLYDAMNKGLARFSGDAVGFLNSDDRFKDDDALSQIAAALAESDIVYGNLDFVADHISGRVVRRWRSTPYRKGAFANGWMPPHPTLYVRRSVIDAVGGFNLKYPIAADYDFMLRALELRDFRVALVDRVLVEMKHGGGSTAGVKAYIRHNLDALRSRQVWLKAGAVDRVLLAKPLRKVTQFVTWSQRRDEGDGLPT